jgi:hypothetical protein
MNTRPVLERAALWIAGAGPLLFFAVATTEGFLRVGYDPIAEPISALALGPRGWIQQLNFGLLAASFLSFAFVLRVQFRRGAASLAAPAVMIVMTIGLVLSGIFPMDAAKSPPTVVGRLHVVGGFLIFPWMPVVPLVAARRFRLDGPWRRYFAYTLTTAILSAATITFFLLFVGPPGVPRPLSELAGLVQRVQLVPFFAWMAVIAARAYVRPAAGPRRGQSTAASTSTSTSTSDLSDQLSSEPRSWESRSHPSERSVTVSASTK